jgi:hypothetical protein
MKRLIDECLPRKLKHSLVDHSVNTVPEMGWAGKKNGELLRLMTDIVDVFVTIYNNLEYQQQIAGLPVSFVLLSAKNNKLETLLPLMEDVRKVLETIRPGEVVRIRAK